jgi:hypothetical protein
MANKTRYPYHDSLKPVLKTVDAPLVALRLIRHVSFSLSVSMSETEILLHAASHTDPVSDESIYSLMSRLSTDRITRLVRQMVDANLLAIKTIKGETHYYPTHRVLTCIKQFSR